MTSPFHSMTCEIFSEKISLKKIDIYETYWWNIPFLYLENVFTKNSIIRFRSMIRYLSFHTFILQHSFSKFLENFILLPSKIYCTAVTLWYGKTADCTGAEMWTKLMFFPQDASVTLNTKCTTPKRNILQNETLNV